LVNNATNATVLAEWNDEDEIDEEDFLPGLKEVRYVHVTFVLFAFGYDAQINH
jgi:hypothetical protein